MESNPWPPADASVAEVEVSNSGELKVRRITTAVDCGMAVNPDGFKAQNEGGIVHIFVESRIPWFRTDDGLPQHVGYGPLRPGGND